ncbi:MAG: 2Fe-2S iron-sulfur cluster-binding protein [Myxococcota bacterium]
MPTIHYKDKTITCDVGANLRRVLLDADLSPHNGESRWFNCKGFGTCGTCAVEIDGAVSQETRLEQWRLDFPPHVRASGLRLACQCQVLGDLKLTKHPGFWGQHSPAPPAHTDE